MYRKQAKQLVGKSVLLASLGVLSVILMLCVQSVVGQTGGLQQKVGQAWDFPLEDSSSVGLEGGERVDKSASAAGDLLWRPAVANEQMQQEQQTDWLRQLGQSTGYVSPYFMGLDGQPSRYHAFVDEFKQYSPLANNPTREGRAFKPKLMSTARGFGKRAYKDASLQRNHLTYADLLAAANQNAINYNGKSNSNASR